MATTDISIILKVVDEATSRLSKIAGNVDDFAKRNEAKFTKMAAIGTGAFVGLSVGMNKMLKSAVDVGESINAVEVVFQDAAEGILKFSKTSAKEVGLTEAAFNQMATNTGALLKDTGLSTEDLTGTTIDLTKRAADLASVYNTDVDSAMSAINQAIRGETEAIRKFAGDVTNATMDQYLMAQGLNTTTAELTEQEKRLLRIEVLMAQTNVVAGDFINTSDSLANRQRVMSAQFKKLGATIGEQLIPVVVKLLDKMVPVIDKVIDWIEENPKLTANLLLISAAVAGVTAALGLLGLAIPSIIVGVKGLGAALMFLAANPIGLTIVAIGAVVAAGVTLYKHRDTVKERAYEIWTAIRGFFEDNLNKIKSISSSIGGQIRDIFTNVFDVIKDVAEIAVNFVIAKINSVISKVKSAVNAVKSLVGAGDSASSSGSRAAGGMVMAGVPYRVGELGAETFVPMVNGRIEKSGSGSMSVSVNIGGNITLANGRDDKHLAKVAEKAVIDGIKRFRKGIT